MERLTDRYKGTAYIKGFQCQLRGIGIEKFNEAVEKLADYEDKEIVKNEIDQIEQPSHCCPYCGEQAIHLSKETSKGFAEEYFIVCEYCGLKISREEICLWNQWISNQ